MEAAHAWSTPVAVDRRSERPRGPRKTLDHYVDDLRHAHGLSALVVSGPAGPLASSAHPAIDVARVGALGVFRALGVIDTKRPYVSTTGSDAFHAYAVDVRGRTLYLTSLGGRLDNLAEIGDQLATYVM